MSLLDQEDPENCSWEMYIMYVHDVSACGLAIGAEVVAKYKSSWKSIEKSLDKL